MTRLGLLTVGCTMAAVVRDRRGSPSEGAGVASWGEQQMSEIKKVTEQNSLCLSNIGSVMEEHVRSGVAVADHYS